MTIREVLKLTTAYGFDLDDELKIVVSNKPVQSGEKLEWEELNINGLDLFNANWYVGDRCRLIAVNKR